MTLNELPYEEYRGWYINRGITMPAQGVFEFNVYSSIEKCAAEDEPDHVAGSVEEAREWVDGQVLGGRTSRLFPRTYMDWANLAEDITTRSPELTYKVNFNLSLIRRELPGADYAKRWLVGKAGELGIS